MNDLNENTRRWNSPITQPTSVPMVRHLHDPVQEHVSAETAWATANSAWALACRLAKTRH